ncbi:MAG: DUF455 family protein [Myxococcales bacterium]|nr:DUF455 family protein [Myxococcales bacterium]
MELRAFAVRVLHGATLSEKLVAPGELTDASPGAPAPLERPRRPPELAFPSRRVRDTLPAVAALDDPAVRGKLLHRFANHELLALEIMASTLLRFPEAPAGFRLGLGRTMAEEQRHLARYLARMSALGVEPGAVPVNDFFWRACESMRGPMDYVLRMALTFEQANLDFTRHWRERFTMVGDHETAAVLDEVYQDEIGHVRGGLMLFRQWKDPALSDWAAFEGGLCMPLSPARARGADVDREGRRQVGFTADWIDRIELYARSRGRPPRVFAFNPGCEEEVADRHRPPGAAAVAVAEDLAPLMALVASPDDVVITPRLPSAEWRRIFFQAGLGRPEFVTSAAELADRRVGELVPWGASPVVGRRFEPLPGSAGLWTDGQRPAFDKRVAFGWRTDFLRELDEDWLAEPVGAVLSTAEDVVAAIDRGWIVKAPFSTAGRDRRRGPFGASDHRWLTEALRQHGSVRVEPWRDRVLDLSLHFDVGTRCRFVGICCFETTSGGRFLGTRPGRWADALEPDLSRFLTGDGKHPRRLRVLGERIAAFLGPRLGALGVSGAVGVDAFVYRDGAALKLDPLCEVNARLTMGRLSLALDPRIHPASRARWRFEAVSRLGASPAAWFAALQAARPLTLRDGLLSGGVVATNDPGTASMILSVLYLEPAVSRSRWRERGG